MNKLERKMKEQTWKKKKKNIERQKLSFPEESVENADFYQLVLNQIVATHQ